MRMSSLCLLATLGLAGAANAQEAAPKLLPRMVAPRAVEPASSQTQSPDIVYMLQGTVNDLVKQVAQLQQQLQVTQQQLQQSQNNLQQTQAQLSSLQNQYASHTHTFERTSIGFNNVQVDGKWASYISKNVMVPEQTSKPAQ